MTLRTKLLAAQLPLGTALVFVGVLSVLSVSALEADSRRILQDNFRSVQAAQRMKESCERMDSAALFAVAGEHAKADSLADAHRPMFEQELRLQEANVTEPGEGEITRRLRTEWDGYVQAFGALTTSPSIERYLRELEPRFVAVKTAAEEILTLNQDAMLRKSNQAAKAAARKTKLMTFVSIAAVGVGIFASFFLTSRLLRPLSNLSLVARRLGEGQWSVRAAIIGKDEIARVAHEFNEMASRLEAYRKSSLGELLQAQLASQAAIDSIPDPVMVFEIDGTLLTTNEAADQLLKADTHEPDRGTLTSLEPKLRAAVERVRDHVLLGKGSYLPAGFDETVMTPSPEGERYLLPRATPVYSEEEGVTGATVILQDITRLHRFDELRNNLVSTVAHEFRTPLTSLRMAIHLCVEGAAGELAPKQQDLLTAAREDCERLQTIVDDLLDLARLRAGRSELDLQAADPGELVDQAIEAAETEAVRRKIQIERQVTPSLDKVLADPVRAQLVFANLISNALHHAPEGGSITVTAEPAEGGVRFAITDTGPGIAPEHLPHLFERFYRAPGARTVGAGLGLSIAREIVDAHGGEIGVVNNAAGSGATFWFRLRSA